MNTIKLLILAAHLRTVKEETFDLSTWKCGTTACAIGHACTIPSFIQKGFVLTGDYNLAYPVYKGLAGYAAVKLFFDISNIGAERLFSDESYQDDECTSNHVADRIERCVAIYRNRLKEMIYE